MEEVRYVLFMLDSSLQHDGMIFKSYKEAKQYAIDCINDKYCNRFIVGMFKHTNNERECISHVESFGFKGDKKEATQLQLFKENT